MKQQNDEALGKTCGDCIYCQSSEVTIWVDLYEDGKIYRCNVDGCNYEVDPDDPACDSFA